MIRSGFAVKSSIFIHVHLLFDLYTLNSLFHQYSCVRETLLLPCFCFVFYSFFSDESGCSAVKQSSGAPPPTAESSLCLNWPGLSCDLQVCSSRENNDGSEPQLTLREGVFSFSSQPHSPKHGQGQGDQEKTEMGDDQIRSKSGRRHEAQPEDDFIGSENDEVCLSLWRGIGT